MVRLEGNENSSRHRAAPTRRKARLARKSTRLRLKKRVAAASRKGVAKPQKTTAQKENAAAISKTHITLRTLVDKQMTNAVEYAEFKLRKGCLRPKGSLVALKNQVTAADRKRKPTPGQPCIAVPQGHVSAKRQAVVAWEPATFCHEIYMNSNAKKRLAILRRTDAARVADLRSNPYFCVLLTDVYAVPHDFPKEFAKRFDPVTTKGLYVVENSNGDAYVGFSKNITKRVKEHNGILKGGARATAGKGPWRRVQPLTDDQPSEKDPAREQRELTVQKASRGASKVWGGSECQRVKPSYSQ